MADDHPDSADKAEDLDNDTSPQSGKQKSCKKSRLPIKRILLAVIIFGLALLAFAIHGALPRWIIGDQLTKFAEKQKLSGKATVSGNLIDGFSIEKASFSGKQGFQTLDIGDASIRYSLLDLIKQRKIDSITLSDATIKVDTAKFVKSEQEKAKKPLRESLATLRKLITQPMIQFDNLDVQILKNNQQLFACQLTQLTHASDSDTFSLASFIAQDSESRGTEAQDVQITWLENGLEIDQWELLPEIAIRDTSFDWRESPDSYTGQTEIRLHDALLTATFAEKITLKLTEGAIDSAKLEESLGIELPASFNITQLNTTIDQWQEAIPLWDISTEIQASHADYQQYQTKETSISITQKDADYEVTLDTNLSDAPLTANVSGTWNKPNSQQWWKDTDADYQVSTSQLGNIPELWTKPLDEIKWANSKVNLEGEISSTEESIHHATLNASIAGVSTSSGEAVPTLIIAGIYDQNKVTLKTTFPDREDKDFSIHAIYQIPEKFYDASLHINESDTSWINAILEAYESPALFTKDLKVHWSGSGSLGDKASHTGNLGIQKLQLSLPQTPLLDIESAARYDWPQSVNIDSLIVRERVWSFQTSAMWEGQNLIIPALIVKNDIEAVLGGSAMIPLSKDTLKKETFFAQEQPWYITLKTKSLAFTQLENWLRFTLPDQITGKNDVYIELTGSPSAPQTKGFINLIDVDGLNARQNGLINARFDFASEQEKIRVKTILKEATTERLVSNGLFPFTPNEWIHQPGLFATSIKASPVSGNLNIKEFPLSKLNTFVPQLEKIQGVVSGKGDFSGSWDEPIYDLDITVQAPLVKLTKSSIGDIKDVELKTNITQQLVLKTELNAEINGGKFELNGEIDINDLKKPLFDLNLDTQYALIYRDDLLSTRTNAKLNLKGTMDDATLSGRIGVVESLIYKDLELIPIGVPSSEVSKVKLPLVSAKDTDQGYPIPAPFNDWKLDVTLLTEDPILIRGNIAKGYIQGEIKIGGTLSKPAPDGTVYANDLKARLPFSLLNIDQGEIIFSPEKGFNPDLKILGKSSIGSYDINLLIYGSSMSPQTTMTSSPPLPESEIMSLLATGSTTLNLANGDVAAFKAFQIFLMKMNQRDNRAGGNKLFHLLLQGMENLNINVGQINQFTGRKYTSASLEIDPRWHLTAQVYDSEQARGLIVYVIKFR